MFLRLLSASALIFFSTFTIQDAKADFEVITSDSYSEIIEIVKNEQTKYSTDELFFVFDLDDTVIRSIDCLGSKTKATGFWRFELTVQNCPAQIASPLLPNFLASLQNQNYAVMAMTARSGRVFKKSRKRQILTGTLSQLEDRLIFSEKKPEPLFVTFPTAPNYSNRLKVLPFDQKGKKGMLKKELVIKRGVSFTSGASKGLALQAFTKSLGKKNTFKRLVFFDDDIKNIRALKKAYEGHKDSILIFHYTEHHDED